MLLFPHYNNKVTLILNNNLITITKHIYICGGLGVWLMFHYLTAVEPCCRVCVDIVSRSLLSSVFSPGSQCPCCNSLVQQNIQVLQIWSYIMTHRLTIIPVRLMYNVDNHCTCCVSAMSLVRNIVVSAQPSAHVVVKTGSSMTVVSSTTTTLYIKQTILSFWDLCSENTM